MSTPKTARVRAVEHFGHSALIHATLIGDAALGERGGKYVIVDTGLALSDGKRRKRAYSLIAADEAARSFTLAVYGVPGGLGADYMLRLREGDTLTFSGPWGKLVAPDDTSGDATRPLWVIATDSGVSAALGLLGDARFAAHLSRTRFLHLLPEGTPFLTPEVVHARLPAVRSRELSDFPPVGSEARYAALRTRVARWLSEEVPEAVYVTGDGALPERIAAQLRDAGHDSSVHSENFFNHPLRKSETPVTTPV